MSGIIATILIMIATTIFTKCFSKCFDWGCELVSKALGNKPILITQEDKDELAQGMRIATRTIRYALKNHNGKEQLTFGSGLEMVDLRDVTHWLDGFLDTYYAILNKKVKQQIKTIHNLTNSLDMFYLYSYSFFDNISDSAYSPRYKQKFHYYKLEQFAQGQKIADEIFEITLPQLLNAYTKLTELVIKTKLIGE